MRRASIVLLLGISLAALAACTPEENAGQKAARRVETLVVRLAPDSQTISTTGEIGARVQSDLSFRVSGRIIQRLVEVGDKVKAGQVLARIDAEEQKADLQVAIATLQSAEAQATQAQKAFDRQQSLFSSGVATRAQVEDAQKGLLTANAVIESAQAQVGTAQDAFGQTELKADADGVITARAAEVGQVAQAAQRVFTLAHDGPRDAVINADESTLLGRKLEDDVEVRLLSGGEVIRAKVREVSPSIDTSTGTIRVKLGLENAPADLALGSPVEATARYVSRETMELPWSAMTSAGRLPAVWVVDPQTRKVSVRPVDVSTYSTGRFSVRSGLAPGDIVVSNGTKFLSEGEVVEIQGAVE